MAGDIFHWNGKSWKADDTTYRFNFFPQSISASSADNVWIGGSGGAFGPVAAIPGTSSSLMAAGVENTGSTVQHPTIYQLTFG